jgi:hypothetical protein
MNGNPEYPEFARARTYALGAAAAGGLASVLGAILSPAEFYHAYLWAWCGGAWGFMSQRILEAATRTLPYMFVFVIPLLIGMGSVYAYTRPDLVRADATLAHKLPYLNVPFVIVRLVLYFAIWWVFAHLLNRWSLKQDDTSDYRYLRLRKAIAGPGIILYSLAMTFASIDWFMSLEPNWYSTMYPGFHLVAQVLTALAVVIIAARHVAARTPRPDVFTPKAFHDLGNLLLTFVILWAYVQVAQLIITWQGNLPKEVAWYLHRTRGNWAWIALVLAVGHFFLPFFILLSRTNKLRSRTLSVIAAYILVIHMVDYYWNAEPAFHREGLYIHWMDIAAPVGLGGAWIALFVWQLKKRPAVPVHDPRLEQALGKAT